jgi:hypothetical protein
MRGNNLASTGHDAQVEIDKAGIDELAWSGEVSCLCEENMKLV